MTSETIVYSIQSNPLIGLMFCLIILVTWIIIDNALGN